MQSFELDAKHDGPRSTLDAFDFERLPTSLLPRVFGFDEPRHAHGSSEQVQGLLMMACASRTMRATVEKNLGEFLRCMPSNVMGQFLRCTPFNLWKRYYCFYA